MIALWLSLVWAQEPEPDPTVLAIVAARDLYPGVPIAEKDLYAVEIPSRFLPDGVYRNPDDVVGLRPQERILANEFLRTPRFEQDPSSSEVPVDRGQRLVQLSVSLGAGAREAVALWRTTEPRCLLTEGVVAGTSPAAAVVLPADAVVAVIRAESAGALVVTPASEAAKGPRCQD